MTEFGQLENVQAVVVVQPRRRAHHSPTSLRFMDITLEGKGAFEILRNAFRSALLRDFENASCSCFFSLYYLHVRYRGKSWQGLLSLPWVSCLLHSPNPNAGKDHELVSDSNLLAPTKLVLS